MPLRLLRRSESGSRHQSTESQNTTDDKLRLVFPRLPDTMF